MALDSLRALIEAIAARGDLVRVDHPVSIDKEITEIADRCMKSPGGGPALLFTRPTLACGAPSRYPVAVNLFGSGPRMALALGVECLDEIGERIAALLHLKVPDTLLGKLALLPQLAEVAKFPPKTAGGRPACQEVVIREGDVDLAQFPVPVCWPEDGGPYITLAGVITRDPGSGTRNVGMYRVQVLGKNELAMHWQRHKVGAAHWRAMAERGERMPVAIALGGDPASIYAASAPLPPTIDEFLFAGFLRREPVRLAKAVTSDLEVPAEAELVLEGYIDPREELVLEGPFGDHTGFYSLADHYPKVHVTAVTLRAEPVWPHTIVGRPPMEDYWLGHATERIFLPLLKLTLPDRGPAHAGRRDLSQPRLREHRQAVSGAGLQGDERSVGAGAHVARQGDRRARSQGGVVGGAEPHRPRARRAVHHGPHRRARPLEPWLHVRLEDGDRRDAQVERRGVHTRVAEQDRHGCRDQTKSR